MPKITVGLPESPDRDREIVCASALYCSCIVIRSRTMIAHVASAHDLSMLIDSLQSERLLERMRWVNYSTVEEHP